MCCDASGYPSADLAPLKDPGCLARTGCEDAAPSRLQGSAKGHRPVTVERGRRTKEAAKRAIRSGVGDAGKLLAAAREDGLPAIAQTGPEAHPSRIVDRAANGEIMH